VSGSPRYLTRVPSAGGRRASRRSATYGGYDPNKAPGDRPRPLKRSWLAAPKRPDAGLARGATEPYLWEKAGFTGAAIFPEPFGRFAPERAGRARGTDGVDVMKQHQRLPSPRRSRPQSDRFRPVGSMAGLRTCGRPALGPVDLLAVASHSLGRDCRGNCGRRRTVPNDGGRSHLPLRGSPGFSPGSLLPRPPPVEEGGGRTDGSRSKSTPLLGTAL